LTEKKHLLLSRYAACSKAFV